MLENIEKGVPHRTDTYLIILQSRAQTYVYTPASTSKIGLIISHSHCITNMNND